jgi:hypothetical protein
MNIFYLHQNPKLASKYHCDKHIVKMPLETAQLLCTAHWLTGTEAPYKPTHKNHPCNLWLLKSAKNYNWLTKLGKELCQEYTYRYGKVHACEKIIDWCIANKPNLPNVKMTEPALAMPDECKTESAIESYRVYYAMHKKHLHQWSKRPKPTWLDN